MRQSRIITLFGGSGFLGRHLVPLLAREGFIVRLPVRSLDKALPLKMAGDPGQIVPFLASINHDASVARALHGANAAINLVGTLYEKGHRTFQNVHVEMAARIARIAKNEGVKHLVHLSALGADAQSDSDYVRTKALGEKAVQAFFSDAAILRPSIIFGTEDRFLNRFIEIANWLPALPLINHGQTRFQPVHVDDVATAILTCLFGKETQGKIYELGGPEILTLRAMIEKTLSNTNGSCSFVNVSTSLAYFLAFFLEVLPEPPLTRLMVKSLLTDNFLRAHSPCGTFANLGICPRSLKAALTTP